MTVSENDIVSNAAAIAAIVNSITPIQVGDLTEKVTPAADDFVHLSEKTTKDDFKAETQNLPGGGGGSKPDFIHDIIGGKAGFEPSGLVLAPLETNVGSNNSVQSYSLDDSTDEGWSDVFKAPPDLTGGSTILFETVSFSDEGSPSGNAVLAIAVSVTKSDGTESWDIVYGTPVVSAGVAFDTQKRYEAINWSETAATLGIEADDIVKYILFRDISADTLGGNLEIVHARIRIPIT